VAELPEWPQAKAGAALKESGPDAEAAEQVWPVSVRYAREDAREHLRQPPKAAV